MSDCLLPQEVVAEILSRVPVKPLLTFRCVCKSWDSLITSASFIKIHLNQAKKKKLLLTRYMSSNSEQYSLRFDNAEMGEVAGFKSPFEAKIAYFRVVGVCNGLICLSDDLFGYTYTLIIWNPAIRRFLKLPKPSVDFDSYGPYMFALGFGFDSRKDEYKVVRLSYIQQIGGKTLYLPTPKVEVYVVGTDSWRTIKCGVPSCSMAEYTWAQALLNGSVHWTGFEHDRSKGRRNAVLSFGMADEKFRIFGFPDNHTDTNPLHFSIGLFGDSLALFVYNNPVSCANFAVYVMKEYGVVESWSKMFIVEMKIGRMLGFREDGEMLIVTPDNEIASVEPNSKRTKNLGIRGYKGSLYAAGYEESLSLLNGLKGDLASQFESYESLVAVEDSSDGEDDVDEEFISKEARQPARSGKVGSVTRYSIGQAEQEPGVSLIFAVVCINPENHTGLEEAMKWKVAVNWYEWGKRSNSS